MSIDLDSFDAWTFRSVCTSLWRPRVITVEYSPLFPLNSTLTIAWPEVDTIWNLTKYNYVGASLGALDAIARGCGYTLAEVHVDRSGRHAALLTALPEAGGC